MEVFDRPAIRCLEFWKLVGYTTDIRDEWHEIDEEDQTVELPLLFQPLEECGRHL